MSCRWLCLTNRLAVIRLALRSKNDFRASLIQIGA